MLKAPANDDMAALDQPNRSRQWLPDYGVGHRPDPGPRGVDQNARSLHLAATPSVEHQLPVASPLRTRAAGARPDNRAVLGSIQCVQSNKPGIVHPAIGILETIAKGAFQRLTDHVVC